MTTYVPIPNGDIDQDSPVTQPLLTALRDNPIAMAEGDPTAPKIQLPAIVDALAGMAAGGIGTYVFARTTNTSNYSYGATIAGSSLVSTGAYYFQKDIANMNATGSQGLASGAALSGTWRCMGTHTYSTTDLNPDTAGSATSYFYGATLWMRIS